MKETLCSVGIDLGTSTTQMVVSELTLENQAGAFSVPRMEITNRKICYRSDIHFTPLRSETELDAEKIKELIKEEYRKANIQPEDVQTGAVIITGETARKENAAAVLSALSELAGSFVVETAGPALESVLAARGAGADRYAKEHGVWVLHLDIGGGTTNFALFEPSGALVETGCVNVGGRLMKFSPDGTVLYRSPVLEGTCAPAVGIRVTQELLTPLIALLVEVLEESCGLHPRKTVGNFITDRLVNVPPQAVTLSFSGGVGALISQNESNWLRYGDLGVLLGKAIGKSALCQGPYVLGKETVQATVVGAGSYTTELSGSTVEYHKVEFPIKNLPVICVPETCLVEQLGSFLSQQFHVLSGGPAAVALNGVENPTFEETQRYAEALVSGMKQAQPPYVIVLQTDMAKALGQALEIHLGETASLICLDSLSVPENSYLDIAAPVGKGASVPVVVKTLAFM